MLKELRSPKSWQAGTIDQVGNINFLEINVRAWTERDKSGLFSIITCENCLETIVLHYKLNSELTLNTKRLRKLSQKNPYIIQAKGNYFIFSLP